MSKCGTYVADPSFQLAASAGKTGPYDCTAHAMSDVIDQATCGKVDPLGRLIRGLSNEPKPDRKSPGLNLAQVAAVAEERYAVPVQVFIGSRALTWAQYEARRAAGQPAIIQVAYGPIADSPQDAFGNRFRTNHAIAETNNATYDPGADGRRAGIWKHDGRLYDRAMIRAAAEQLVVDTHLGHPIRAGKDNVWCLFAPDVVPDYTVTIRPKHGQKTRTVNTYTVSRGVISGFKPRSTRGFTASGRIRCVPWPARKANRYLIRITSGPWKGLWVNAAHGKEV